MLLLRAPSAKLSACVLMAHHATPWHAPGLHAETHQLTSETGSSSSGRRCPHGSCVVQPRWRGVACDAGNSVDPLLSHLSSMADKYVLGVSNVQQRRRSRQGRARAAAQQHHQQRLPVQAIHVLLSCMAAASLLVSSGTLLGGGAAGGALLPAKLLTLDHLAAGGRWWTLLSDALVSTSSGALARSLFFGYMFGRVVQNTEGGGALAATFTLSALGGSAASLLLLPRRATLAGCGASGALFGLFAAAALFNRHKAWHWQRAFELAVLTPFVLQQLAGSSSSSSSLAACSVALGPLLRLPGPCVPLLGGLLGAAAAAALLAGARALAARMHAQQRGAAAAQAHAVQPQQQPQQQRQRGGSAHGAREVSQLLTQALGELLRRILTK